MQLHSSESEEARKKKREKEGKVKKRTIELWLYKHGLPKRTKKKIMKNAKQILKKNKNLVHVENVLRQLPDEELRNSVKRHVYFVLLHSVSSLISYDKLAK